jgi:RNA polymerase sigma factor (sigma-70 family)
MRRTSEIPSESFDQILAWLNPDREKAAEIYLDLRRALVKIFAWNRCVDPEGLTDETFDRVARQVDYLIDTFEGNPKLFFYGVARNLIKEHQKKAKSYISIDDVDVPAEAPQLIDDEDAEVREECLRDCLKELTPDKRNLILAYYAKEKQPKIEDRARIAQQIGVSIETLRVRMCRIRASLEECIGRRLEHRGRRNETD